MIWKIERGLWKGRNEENRILIPLIGILYFMDTFSGLGDYREITLKAMSFGIRISVSLDTILMTTNQSLQFANISQQ